MAPRQLVAMPQAPLVDERGKFTLAWQGVQQRIHNATGWVETYIRQIDAVADMPETLTVDDAGARVALHGNYDHLLEWTGTVWAFAPGDSGSGYFVDFPAGVVPQSSGWHLCDGSTIDYLIVGDPFLSVRGITLPVTPLRYFRR